MGLLTGGSCLSHGGSPGDPPFSPTEYARQSPSTAVDASGDDYNGGGGSSADADCWLWVETTASETYIRLDAFSSGNIAATENWWDTSDVDQGAPGVDENALALGERVDSVNIYTVNFTETVGAPDLDLFKQGTFTDDDKSTFFNPTNGTNYGYKLEADASDPAGEPAVIGHATIQFTFRKSGFADLTVTYKMSVAADAETGL